MRFPSKLGLKIWCVCWILLLALPIFRTRLEEIPQKPIVELSGPNWRSGDDDVIAANKAKAEVIRAQFPADPVALVEALSLQPRGEDYAREYLALARRFPNERWLQLGAIREGTIGGGVFIEIGDPKFKSQTPRDFPVSQQKLFFELLESAKQTEKREPQNAFPSWMRAFYGFSLGRDDEGEKGLQNAAQRPLFEDGLRVQTQKNWAFFRRKNATWESQMLSWASVSFPHFSGMHSCARRAAWLGWQSWKNGDKTRAARWWNITQRAALPMAQEDYFGIYRRVGYTIQEQFWGQVSGYFGVPWKDANLNRDAEKTELQTQRETAASAFAQAMKRANLPDLEKFALDQAQKTNSPNAWLGIRFQDVVAAMGKPQMIFTARAQIFWTICALASLGTAIFWVPLWFFTRAESVKTGALWNAFSLGATFCLWVLVSAVAYLELFYSGEETQKAPEFLRFWPLFSLLFWVLPAIFGATRETEFSEKSKLQITREKPRFWPLLKGISHALLVLALAVAGLLSALAIAFNPSLNDTIWGTIWPACWIVFLVISVGALVFRLLFSRGIERRMAFFGLVIFALVYAALLWAEEWKREGIRSWIWVETYVGAIFVLVWLGFALRALGVVLPFQTRDFWRNFALRLRASCATLAVSCALMCVVLGLVLWPLQRAISASIQEQIRIGTRVWLEKQSR